MTEKYLITGGAGFIGANYADRLLGRGAAVTIFDDLSRPGVAANLDWLRERHGARAFSLIIGDVRNYEQLLTVLPGHEVVVHLAGQTAVTASLADPRRDFEVNGLGTFNVLEAARRTTPHPLLLYASTNKVYGSLKRLAVVEEERRYAFRDLPLGISESHPLDYHSPYSCSKGVGDLYALDYHRNYGLPAVVLRQSAICGPRQMGAEGQGWLAWLMIAAIKGLPLTIYGDGKQVRDVLFIDDLLDAYDLIVEKSAVAVGRAYNIGGGPDRLLSVWGEFGPLLESLLQRRLAVSFAPWRPGDQLVYCSDMSRAAADLGWSPKIPLSESVERFFGWIEANRLLF